MKVLQIVGHMYPNVGGIEQVARDILDVLKTDETIEQKVICMNTDASDGIVTTRHNETVHDSVDGVEVIRCATFAKISSQPLSWTYPFELRKVLNSFQPDVVIFHYPNPFLAQFLLPYFDRKFKLIIYWHLDIIKQKFLGKLFIPQNHALLKRAWKVVGATTIHISASPYASKYKDKSVIIPYCADKAIKRLTQDIKDRALVMRHPGKIMCFALGRHVPYKGMEYLVRASKLLDNRFEIVIGGQGPLTDQLKQLAQNDSKVHFLGRLSEDEIVAYYEACDIYCFPSITSNEAFGLVQAEAMSFAKPIVNFTIPGSGVNVVNENEVTGLECANRNVGEFADAIKKLADNDSLCRQYGLAGREKFIQQYTFECFKRSILDLLKEHYSG